MEPDPTDNLLGLFAPDRPGRYLTRNGHIFTLVESSLDSRGEVEWNGERPPYPGSARTWIKNGQQRAGCALGMPQGYDIIGRAVDDRDWCLARAKLFAKACGMVVRQG
jgi:hypothetical protein